MLSKKQIVFFCATTPYVMVYKIAREFKKKGYETILITISQRDKWDIEWYRNGFDKIICSNFQIYKPTPKNSINMLKRLPYLIRALYQMKKLKPYVVFGVARPNYIVALALKFFKKFPFIYFPYDVSSQTQPDLKTALSNGCKMYEIKAERYCFENADGILHKGDKNELKHLTKENMLGNPLKITPLVISFPPYCSNEFIVHLNKDKLSKKDGEIHLVFIGGLNIDPDNLNFNNNLFKKLLDAKIHTHIYSKTQHLSKEEDKLNLGEGFKNLLKNKYFHLEFALPPKELIPEISKYDFGFWSVYSAEKNNWGLHPFLSGTKIASYLEAGVSFFYNNDFKFVDGLMKKYNLNLPIDFYNFDGNKLTHLIKKMNYKKLEENIIKMRENFNLNKHIPRLEKFLENVVKRKYIQRQNINKKV